MTSESPEYSPILERAILSREYAAALREDLDIFTKHVFKSLEPGKSFIPSWHIELVSEYLMAQTRGEIKDLIINIPPRTLKTTLCSIAWPAWLLGHDPSKQILSASFSNSLSIRHNQDCRRVVESAWYRQVFPDTIIADDQNTKSFFQTTVNGHKMATSVGSSVIGQGGDHLIVDDPIGADQAESEQVRTSANEWFDKAFTTRRNNPETSTRTVVMQRLQSLDLTGYIRNKIAKYGEDESSWEVVVVPLEAEKKTIIDFGDFFMEREAGDRLQPERFTDRVVRDLKEELGSYVFSGQYQQTPAPAGGGMFKMEWFPRYTERPIANRVIQSWDTAGKGETTSAYSVCHTFAETDEAHYLLHVFRGQLSYPQLRAKVTELAEEWDVDALLIEDKSSGEALIQDLNHDTDLPVIAINPEGDKETRASRVSAMCEAGKVVLPDHAPWLTDWETEITTFPRSAQRDQVDSFSQYLGWQKETRNRIDRYRITVL